MRLCAAAETQAFDRSNYMGHHYVPQAYLKGFEAAESPGMVGTYDKERNSFALLPIKNVAQSPGFYDDETERLLRACNKTLIDNNRCSSAPEQGSGRPVRIPPFCGSP